MFIVRRLTERAVTPLLVCFCLGLLFGLIPRAREAQAQPLRLSQSGQTATTGTAFTYQGRLDDVSGPVTGEYDLRFKLFDAPTGGNQVGETITVTVPITDGLFALTLDFGAVFDAAASSGTSLYLSLEAQPTGQGAFDLLEPRQVLTAVPFANYAFKAPWDGISGGPAGVWGEIAADSGSTTPDSAFDTLAIVGLGTVSTAATDGVVSISVPEPEAWQPLQYAGVWNVSGVSCRRNGDWIEFRGYASGNDNAGWPTGNYSWLPAACRPAAPAYPGMTCSGGPNAVRTCYVEMLPTGTVRLFNASGTITLLFFEGIRIWAGES